MGEKNGAKNSKESICSRKKKIHTLKGGQNTPNPTPLLSPFLWPIHACAWSGYNRQLFYYSVIIESLDLARNPIKLRV